MNRKEWLKNIFLSYFIVVTCVNLVMFILGSLFDKDMKFGYEAFLMPLLYGCLGIIPVLVTYSKKELTMKQLLVRKVIQVLLLEGILTAFLWSNRPMEKTAVFSFQFAILLVVLVVHLVLWILDSLKAKELNQDLLQFKRNNS